MENKVGYKKTKLGWIPEDWEHGKINEHTTYVDYRGKTPPKSDTGIFLVTAKNIKQGYIDYNTSKEYIKKEDYEDVMSRGKPEIGDVLITTEAPMGNIAQVDRIDIALAQRVIKYRSNSSKLSNDYLRWYFISAPFQKELDLESTGSTVKGIKGSRLHKMLLILPPLTEQKKIAQILSTWNQAIEQYQELITQLKLRKKGLMQSLLTGKVRLAGFSGEWEELTLNDISDRITNKNKELNDNVVTISAQRGFVRQEDFFKKRVASNTLSGYYLINKGDYAYNKSYSNGYPMGAFKRLDNFDKAVVTTLYICFSIRNNVDSDFLINYFEGSLMVKNLMRIAQEGGRAHGLLNIGLNDFFSLKLKIPTKKEQKAIAEILLKADQEITQQENYLSTLQSQKKGLMQQLLTGQKRVKVD